MRSISLATQQVSLPSIVALLLPSLQSALQPRLTHLSTSPLAGHHRSSPVGLRHLLTFRAAVAPASRAPAPSPATSTESTTSFRGSLRISITAGARRPHAPPAAHGSARRGSYERGVQTDQVLFFLSLVRSKVALKEGI